MSVKEPPLLPILRSALQARILLRLLTTDQGATAADLARALEEPEPSVTREVRRLLGSGLLRGEPIGRAVRLYPVEDNPATAPLRQLLIVTFGPSHLLERGLAGIAGIDEAFVYGSWAARYQGEPGDPPGDIDVLIVGDPVRGQVDDAVDAVEQALGREVNVTYVRPERWDDDTDPFIATVRSRPLVHLGTAPTKGSRYDGLGPRS